MSENNIKNDTGIDSLKISSSFDTLKLDAMQYSLHTRAWHERKINKSPSHVRAAFLQIELIGKLGDGYHFPIKPEEIAGDIEGNKVKKNKYHKECQEYKYQEYRRQEILNKTLDACDRLGVEFLVLPEYSVQPDTILWLKEKLRNKKVSILAGTYRLSDDYKDKKKVISKSYFDSSRSYQAILSLLVPYKDKVVCLNRTKKYASAAANELIHPYQYAITPLFTIDKFEGEVLSSNTTLESQLEEELSLLSQETTLVSEIEKIRKILSINKAKFGVDDIQYLYQEKHLRVLNFVQEVICAELFLLTNPTNSINLASEYKKLCQIFGIPNSESEFSIIREDLDSLTQYLSGVGSGGGNADTKNLGELNKRSIMAIPAMTTRKQDYWIFGQGAMLANGCSTIFCNPAGKSYGGSCFIGLDSWVENETEFITPYNGWSKGIYYGHKDDALSKEQALVIADIDPLMMSLGYPRPQSLPVPMKLVGYLPILEINEERQNIYYEALSSLENAFTNKANLNKSVNPKNFTLLEKSLNELFEKDPDIYKACLDRINHWHNNWNKYPQVGIPALTDWVGVCIKSLDTWEKENTEYDG